MRLRSLPKRTLLCGQKAGGRLSKTHFVSAPGRCFCGTVQNALCVVRFRSLPKCTALRSKTGPAAAHSQPSPSRPARAGWAGLGSATAVRAGWQSRVSVQFRLISCWESGKANEAGDTSDKKQKRRKQPTSPRRSPEPPEQAHGIFALAERVPGRSSYVLGRLF